MTIGVGYSVNRPLRKGCVGCIHNESYANNVKIIEEERREMLDIDVLVDSIPNNGFHSVHIMEKRQDDLEYNVVRLIEEFNFKEGRYRGKAHPIKVDFDGQQQDYIVFSYGFENLYVKFIGLKKGITIDMNYHVEDDEFLVPILNVYGKIKSYYICQRLPCDVEEKLSKAIENDLGVLMNAFEEYLRAEKLFIR